MLRLAGVFVGHDSGIANGLRIVALRARTRRALRILAIANLSLLLITGVALETRNSWIQSRLFTSIARRLSFKMGPGPSAEIRYPSSGPYDHRMGYAELPQFQQRLATAGFEITAQARSTATLRRLQDLSLSAIYPEKSQAGLEILDRDGRPLYARQFPGRTYASFEAIPPIVVSSLLFVENRELLDTRSPRRNPAVEWDRLGRALLDAGIRQVHHSHRVSGGSTLATQLEKMRHSPEGRTASFAEKGRQMASASIRSYLGGSNTLAARKAILRDYFNSLPLTSIAGYGEVDGLGDGLWAWFGADFDRVNSVLSTSEAEVADEGLRKERAIAFRQVLSLLLAVKKPTAYLRRDQRMLDSRVDSYIRLLADAGVISPRMRDAALSVHPPLRDHVDDKPKGSFAERKAADAMRVRLLGLLGVASTYDLDRLDATVRTTLDSQANSAVLSQLNALNDPAYAAGASVFGKHLLSPDNLRSVIYSFTLYERTPDANVLRVQVDNLNQPLNINQGTRLELGSTAKLRTLVTYLETVAELHAQYSSQQPAAAIMPRDHLSRWAVDYLAQTSDKSLPAMLEAAMNRTYSANPGEWFFTGGGMHHFRNFEREDNVRVLTVREAFQRSVNLVFIRIMQDLVNYRMFREPGISPDILENADNPLRSEYLRRFADIEGNTFLKRFYNRSAGLPPDETLDKLVARNHPTPKKMAVIYRFLRPGADYGKFQTYLKAHFPRGSLTDKLLVSLYGTYAPGKFNLNDTGYLARVHPLELWLLDYLRLHPQATFAEASNASARERQDVYRWLFRPRRFRGQNTRIRTLLEVDAFEDIGRSWRRLGYPFPKLVPSYATAIGSSGDNPAALAELVGIIVNDGMRSPAVGIRQLHFAARTPFETVMDHRRETRQLVLSPLIAGMVKREMVGVVENGTARRAFGAVVLSGGRILPVGGKTGTGDNRLHIYSAGGAEIGSKVVNRTAAFVFVIGDRFYGTMIAYVPGAAAGSYGFTSALPVQVFRNLVPSFRSVLEHSADGG